MPNKSNHLDLNAELTQVLTAQDEDYLYGLGSTPVAQNDPNDVDYLFTDGLGSVRQIVRGDSYGQVTLTRTYDPFGNLLSSVGNGASAFGYAGQWGDGSGLMNMRARFYDSSDGRFLTEDSWQGDPNQPMSYNSWLYVNSNPINNIDVTGNWTCYGKTNCEEWVNNALSKLSNSGETGRRVVQFFHEYDSVIQKLNQDDLDNVENNYLYGDRSECNWKANGLLIYFGTDVLFGMANTFYPREILINMKDMAKGPLPNNFEVTTFGHEISHYKQGRDRFSIQGEMFAEFLQGQIWLDLGNKDLSSLPNSIIAELLTGNEESRSTEPYPYNPFTDSGLTAAKKYLINHSASGWGYSIFPLSVKGLSEDWLSAFSVNWYKATKWYRDFKRSVV